MSVYLNFVLERDLDGEWVGLWCSSISRRSEDYEELHHPNYTFFDNLNDIARVHSVYGIPSELAFYCARRPYEQLGLVALKDVYDAHKKAFKRDTLGREQYNITFEQFCALYLGDDNILKITNKNHKEFRFVYWFD